VKEVATHSTISLSIVSAEGRIYSGDVRMVVVPSVKGDVGILPRHAPLLANLLPGEVRILTPEENTEYIYVSGGYAEIQPFAVTILADTAMRGQEVDEKAALEAKKRAEETMSTARLFLDRDRAHIELLKALAQLKALEHARRNKRGI
jgi:F-type H+-transporting ATPase subunit epsilon